MKHTFLELLGWDYTSPTRGMVHWWGGGDKDEEDKSSDSGNDGGTKSVFDNIFGDGGAVESFFDSVGLDVDGDAADGVSGGVANVGDTDGDGRGEFVFTDNATNQDRDNITSGNVGTVAKITNVQDNTISGVTKSTDSGKITSDNTGSDLTTAVTSGTITGVSNDVSSVEYDPNTGTYSYGGVSGLTDDQLTAALSGGVGVDTGVDTSYVIQPGDTLSEIAEGLDTSVGELMDANPNITNPNQINAGDTLNVSGVKTGVDTYEGMDQQFFPEPEPEPEVAYDKDHADKVDALLVENYGWTDNGDGTFTTPGGGSVKRDPNNPDIQNWVPADKPVDTSYEPSTIETSTLDGDTQFDKYTAAGEEDQSALDLIADQNFTDQTGATVTTDDTFVPTSNTISAVEDYVDYGASGSGSNIVDDTTKYEEAGTSDLSALDQFTDETSVQNIIDTANDAINSSTATGGDGDFVNVQPGGGTSMLPTTESTNPRLGYESGTDVLQSSPDYLTGLDGSGVNTTGGVDDSYYGGTGVDVAPAYAMLNEDGDGNLTMGEIAKGLLGDVAAGGTQEAADRVGGTAVMTDDLVGKIIDMTPGLRTTMINPEYADNLTGLEDMNALDMLSLEKLAQDTGVSVASLLDPTVSATDGSAIPITIIDPAKVKTLENKVQGVVDWLDSQSVKFDENKGEDYIAAVMAGMPDPDDPTKNLAGEDLTPGIWMASVAAQEMLGLGLDVATVYALGPIGVGLSLQQGTAEAGYAAQEEVEDELKMLKDQGLLNHLSDEQYNELVDTASTKAFYTAGPVGGVADTAAALAAGGFTKLSNALPKAVNAALGFVGVTGMEGLTGGAEQYLINQAIMSELEKAGVDMSTIDKEAFDGVMYSAIMEAVGGTTAATTTAGQELLNNRNMSLQNNIDNLTLKEGATSAKDAYQDFDASSEITPFTDPADDEQLGSETLNTEDTAGETVKIYHATKGDPFTQYDSTLGDNYYSNMGAYGPGFYGSLDTKYPSDYVGGEGSLMSAEVDISNMLDAKNNKELTLNQVNGLVDSLSSRTDFEGNNLNVEWNGGTGNITVTYVRKPAFSGESLEARTVTRTIDTTNPTDVFQKTSLIAENIKNPLAKDADGLVLESEQDGDTQNLANILTEAGFTGVIGIADTGAGQSGDSDSVVVYDSSIIPELTVEVKNDVIPTSVTELTSSEENNTTSLFGDLRQDYSSFGGDGFTAFDLTTDGNTIGYATQGPRAGYMAIITPEGRIEILAPGSAKTNIFFDTAEEAVNYLKGTEDSTTDDTTEDTTEDTTVGQATTGFGGLLGKDYSSYSDGTFVGNDITSGGNTIGYATDGELAGSLAKVNPDGKIEILGPGSTYTGVSFDTVDEAVNYLKGDGQTGAETLINQEGTDLNEVDYSQYTYAPGVVTATDGTTFTIEDRGISDSTGERVYSVTNNETQSSDIINASSLTPAVLDSYTTQTSSTTTTTTETNTGTTTETDTTTDTTTNVETDGTTSVTTKPVTSVEEPDLDEDDEVVDPDADPTADPNADPNADPTGGGITDLTSDDTPAFGESTTYQGTRIPGRGGIGPMRPTIAPYYQPVSPTRQGVQPNVLAARSITSGELYGNQFVDPIVSYDPDEMPSEELLNSGMYGYIKGQ